MSPPVTESLKSVDPLAIGQSSSIALIEHHTKSAAKYLENDIVIDPYLNTWESIARSFYSHVLSVSKKNGKPYRDCFQNAFNPVSRNKKQTPAMWANLVKLHITRDITPDKFYEMVFELNGIESFLKKNRDSEMEIKRRILVRDINDTGLGFNSWYTICEKEGINYLPGSSVTNYKTNETAKVINDNGDHLLVSIESAEVVWDKTDLAYLSKEPTAVDPRYQSGFSI